MIGAFSIIFPSGYQVEVTKLRQQLDEAHFAWATEWKRQRADFKLENIGFVHDPLWNERLFSVQSARDGKTWLWKATHMIVRFGVLSI